MWRFGPFGFPLVWVYKRAGLFNSASPTPQITDKVKWHEDGSRTKERTIQVSGNMSHSRLSVLCCIC